MAKRPVAAAPRGANPANVRQSETTEGNTEMNMMTSITAIAARADVWNLHDWVERFEAVGGYLTADGVGWRVFGSSDADQMQARLIYGEIEFDEHKKDMVCALGKARSLRPDLRKAPPIEEVIRGMSRLRNAFPFAFLEACKASGIDISVIRDRDGVDRLTFGCACDDQEDMRRDRLNALSRLISRSVQRRQDTIVLVNALGRFADNQPFGSVSEAAWAYLEAGGRIFANQSGHCEETMPYRDEIADDARTGHSLRRMLHRYDATLRQKGARKEMTNLVLARGTLHQGSGFSVLEGACHV